MEVVVFMLCFFHLIRFLSGSVASFDWNYGSGAQGPAYWKNIHKRCGGAHQSPININTEDAMLDPQLKPFELKLTNAQSAYIIENVGLNFKVTLGSSIWRATFSGTNYCYQLGQLHFHWGSTNSKGSEHRINGKAYPIEAHFVMWNCEYYTSLSQAAGGVNGLAVMGVFFEVDDSAAPEPTFNALVDKLKTNSIKQCPCANTTDYATLSIPFFNVTKLLPSPKSTFFRYKGSLTTPPCTENVLWTVYEKPMKISTAQLNTFRALLNRGTNNGGIANMVNNDRPVMPLNPKAPVTALRYVSYSKGVSFAINLLPFNVLSFAAFVSIIINNYLE